MPRPKGSKNKSTLMREFMEGKSELHLAKVLKGAEYYLVSEVPAIVRSMAEKAKKGDVQAAKLLLDRAMPAKRATDDVPSGVEIVINVGGIADAAQAHQGVQPVTINANRQNGERPQSGEGGQAAESAARRITEEGLENV